MLNFKKIEKDDFSVLKAYLTAYPSRQCDRSPGALMMWRNRYDNRYAVIDGTIIFSSNFTGEICFSMPIGRNPDAALTALEEYCKENNIPMIINSVNAAELPSVIEKYPDSVYSADRDWFDYLYEKSAIASLSGRKYNTQRNHINKFKKLYTDWAFEPISEENIGEVIAFMESFTFSSEKEESAFDEAALCLELLKNYEIYQALGGVIRVNGKIIAFSVCEIIGDTFICHIEKADTNYAGAYQMLTNQMLLNYAASEEVKFVNREEDCGDEGLRKSKLSYHPCELIEKNVVTINFN